MLFSHGEVPNRCELPHISVSCFVAHGLPPFWMPWASPKHGVLEMLDKERAFSETKASGSGKESPRLPETGLLGPEVRHDSSCNSRSMATHRWRPRSMISPIDRKRNDAGSPSSGRVRKEKTSMIQCPYLDLRGNRNGIPPGSIYAIRPTRASLPSKNLQSLATKWSRQSQKINVD